MKLFSYFRSSCSYRVRIALALKGLAYEYVPVHLLKDGGEQNAGAYRALNAMAQVPTLEIEHRPGVVVRLTQSVAICEYLEERFPEPALMPSDPLARATVRKCVEIINSGIQPLQNLSTMADIKRLGGDATVFARAANERGLAALEVEAEASGGPYLTGASITLADVFLVPQIFAARRFDVDTARFPRLTEIDAKLAEHPAFVAAHPSRQVDAAL